MTDTPNRALPCNEDSQAQKHITHNDALRILDSLVQLAVLTRTLTAPPGSPSDGERWIVKPTATGAWAGHDNEVAAWQDGAWIFSTPQTGWLAYIVDEGALLAWNGSAWVDAIAALTSLNNLTLLGVGTTADTTNPLSAKLNNTLFAAKAVAEGGSGDLRYKLSKEASTNTLSFLFQDNFSGRAEIGLTGDDDFHFKVSADGTTWNEGIVIDKTTGGARFPVAETDVASAATCDIGAAANLKVHITGTTNVTSFGTAVNSIRFIRFAGVLTLTHNATSLILPSGANIATAAGDCAIATSDASGNWRVRHYQRADGSPLMPKAPIGLFAAKRTSAQSGLAVGGFTKIQLDTEEVDAAGWYDNATNYRYTPQKAGWYWFYFGIQLVYTGSSAEAAVAAVYKNGSIAKQSGPMFVLGSGNCTVAAAEIGALVQMNGSTDYVEFFAYSGSGATASATASSSPDARVFAGGWKVADF